MTEEHYCGTGRESTALIVDLSSSALLMIARVAELLYTQPKLAKRWALDRSRSKYKCYLISHA
jgi:hypothetical protein